MHYDSERQEDGGYPHPCPQHSNRSYRALAEQRRPHHSMGTSSKATEMQMEEPGDHLERVRVLLKMAVTMIRADTVLPLGVR
jgi:hypothetical protein